jgi:hypothetical protein
MEDHRIPGAPKSRIGHLRVGVARSKAIREAERDLENRTLIVVPLDASVHLESLRVKREVMRQLGIPIFGEEESRMAGASFLLCFDTIEWRNDAHRRGAFMVGHVQLRLMPWRHQVSATTLSRFRYKVRVCIEGVPKHVRRACAVDNLFPRPSFVDDEFCDTEKSEEEQCLCLWVWTPDLEGIPISAILHVVEPVTLPQDGYAEILMELGMPVGAMRIDQAKVLDYEVLVHVDCVLDYAHAPMPVSPSHQTYTSDTSGLPDDELEPEWPARHPFMWRLGVPDDVCRRVPVHERLGGRGRQRSPQRGGGWSGLPSDASSWFQSDASFWSS